MRLKTPDGGIAWVSALWALLGAFVSYNSFVHGDLSLGIAGVVFCVAGVLVWLDVRAVAWPLMIWFAVVIASGMLLLLFKGVSIRPITGILLAGYTIYELNSWRHTD